MHLLTGRERSHCVTTVFIGVEAWTYTAVGDAVCRTRSGGPNVSAGGLGLGLLSYSASLCLSRTCHFQQPLHVRSVQIIPHLPRYNRAAQPVSSDLGTYDLFDCSVPAGGSFSQLQCTIPATSLNADQLRDAQ
jgi:hypothetical protein